MLCVWVYQVNLSALNPWKEGFVEQEYIFSAHIIQRTHCATYDILFKLPPPLGSKNGLVSQQNRIKSCVNGRLAAPHRNFSQVFFTCCFSIRERVLEKCYFSYLWDIEDRGLCGQRLCGHDFVDSGFEDRPYLIFVIFSPPTQFFTKKFSTQKRVNCAKTDLTKTA